MHNLKFTDNVYTVLKKTPYQQKQNKYKNFDKKNSPLKNKICYYCKPYNNIKMYDKLTKKVTIKKKKY